jgi:hypothetical protein
VVPEKPRCESKDSHRKSEYVRRVSNKTLESGTCCRNINGENPKLRTPRKILGPMIMSRKDSYLMAFTKWTTIKGLKTKCISLEGHKCYKTNGEE